MSRIAFEQLTFDFEGEASKDIAERQAMPEGAQVLVFSHERLLARKQQAEKERERLLLEDAARRVRYF